MKNYSVIKYLFAAMMAVSMVFIFSACDEDDPPGPSDPRPFADFTYELSSDNFLVVNFTNASKFSTGYSWEFGENLKSGYYNVLSMAVDKAGNKEDINTNMVVEFFFDDIDHFFSPHRL